MEAKLVSTASVAKTVEHLQVWANDPDLARSNLRTIFECLDEGESLIDWANEALENCGPSLPKDHAFLAEQLQSVSSDRAYWACKVLARSSTAAQEHQAAICAIAVQPSTPEAVRIQAMLALQKIDGLSLESRTAVERLVSDESSKIAALAKQIASAS
jgi:hypothetical protein